MNSTRRSKALLPFVAAACLWFGACLNPLGLVEIEDPVDHCREEIQLFEVCNNVSLLEFVECEKGGGSCLADYTVKSTLCFFLVSGC